MFEELETDTDSLYLAQADEYLYDCIRQEEKYAWRNLRKNDCRDSFRADLKTDFFHEHIVAFTRNTMNENLDSLKMNLGVR